MPFAGDSRQFQTHQSRLGKETGPNWPKYGTWDQPWWINVHMGFFTMCGS